MEAVAADRAGYADALDGMLQMVRDIIAREEAGLYHQVISLLSASAVRRIH
jgi:hypothetical protein